MNLNNLKKKINNFVDIFLNKFVSLVNNSNLSSKSVGFFIRAIHSIVPIILLFLLLFSGKKQFIIIIFFNLFIYALFVIFDGCILSKLELKLINDNFTVIDPFLEIFDIDVTNKNRKKYSIYSWISGFFFIILLYYIRFIY